MSALEKASSKKGYMISLISRASAKAWTGTFGERKSRLLGTAAEPTPNPNISQSRYCLSFSYPRLRKHMVQLLAQLRSMIRRPRPL
jgi:hypothetical protein